MAHILADLGEMAIVIHRQAICGYRDRWHMAILKSLKNIFQGRTSAKGVGGMSSIFRLGSSRKNAISCLPHLNTPSR